MPPDSHSNVLAAGNKDVPVGRFPECLSFLRDDLKSGCLVFFIALPLCLAISIASGFPPLAGVFTAILGGILTSMISNSETTIKGPAAGLIVIVLGCVQDFGGDGVANGFTDKDMMAYRAALAVSVVAALLQIAFACFRGGILGEFFPGEVVHGMLAAIGLIILLKQLPVIFGVTDTGEPLEILRHLPNHVLQAKPFIAAIGLMSLSIMFAWPRIALKLPLIKIVPSQLIVLAVAIPMGIGLGIEDDFLITMPKEVFGMFRELQIPEFNALMTWKAWKWIFLFFIIGSLESLLSAKAVDSLDLYRRKTDLNRDLLSVGVGNLASAFVGGLPMISEIVRSRANIDNGAKTRYSNFWHGIFLLVCVALVPMLLTMIPLSALAAMLVYTGFRLAHPRQLLDAYKMGREHLLVFVVTIIGVLATDLLVGVLIGIGLKIVLLLVNGVPPSSLFKASLEIKQLDEKHSVIHVRSSAVFSNWIPLRRKIEDLGLAQRRNVTIDLSGTRVVDHSTIEKLHEMQSLFEGEGLKLKIIYP